MRYVISVDIGSTYTKGAVFCWDESCESASDFTVLAQAVNPTTVEHLPDGFNQVIASLSEQCPELPSEAPIYFSSSAKGGLAIAAMGIVPELTLKAAKLTALSAGGRIDSVSAYKLTRRDLQNLEAHAPDIILLAGGTDGGNESYITHNTEILAKSRVLPERSTIIYAGNVAVAEDCQDVLTEAGYHVQVVANLLPEVNRMNTEPAREIIRQVFLDRIVKGRGLEDLVKRVGHAPNPTPYAVLNLAAALFRTHSVFSSFILVDLGGATTDVYSCCPPTARIENVVYRGLQEPEVKRTVEGDLGMRVSARPAFAACHDFFEVWCAEKQVPFAEVQAYIEKVANDTSYLAQNAREEAFDLALASACVSEAIRRHAGTQHRVFTPMGESFVQHGKDLRSAHSLIGSGGYLSKVSGFTVPDYLSAAPDPDHLILVPEKLSYQRDKNYLFPLLGNLVSDFESLACGTALKYLSSN